MALHLAKRGHEVVGLDRDEKLLDALRQRQDSLSLETELADAREFELGREFGLVLAPMQLLQLFANEGERAACLRCVAAHLAPGGLAAFAIVEALPPASDAPPPLPDATERDGWVYSSLPIEATADDGQLVVRRLRQSVDPRGELAEEVDEVRLRRLDAATVEREGRAAGLAAAGRRAIPATEEHVGSTVVLLTGEGR